MERADDDLVTVNQAAEELGLSPSSVRLLIHGKQLHAIVKVNAVRPTFRIRRSDLDAYRRERLRDSITDDWE